MGIKKVKPKRWNINKPGGDFNKQIKMIKLVSRVCKEPLQINAKDTPIEKQAKSTHFSKGKIAIANKYTKIYWSSLLSIMQIKNHNKFDLIFD